MRRSTREDAVDDEGIGADPSLDLVAASGLRHDRATCAALFQCAGKEMPGAGMLLHPGDVAVTVGIDLVERGGVTTEQQEHTKPPRGAPVRRR
jgi:hypothetical protein